MSKYEQCLTCHHKHPSFVSCYTAEQHRKAGYRMNTLIVAIILFFGWLVFTYATAERWYSEADCGPECEVQHVCREPMYSEADCCPDCEEVHHAQ